jgi:L-Ala-D/L-Glu epimerase
LKLAEWSLHFYRLRYRRAVTWAYAAESESDYALLKLVADDGTVGIAEGVVKPTRSGYSPRSLTAALEDVLLPRLQGVDLRNESEVHRAFAWVDGNLAGRALVENACCALQGTRGSTDVPVSWIVTRQAPAQMAAEAAEMCARYGFRSLKLKGGQGIDTDLRVIAEVRAALGAQVELSMDANRAYPAAGIDSYVRAIADAGVRVAEDPCELAPDSAFERLQRESSIALLVDFANTSRQDAALFLERGARALMIKPGRIGIPEAREIDALCAARGASVSLGMWYESALGAALTLRVASSLKSRVILPAECFFPMLAEQVSLPLKIEKGAVRLPDEPNLARLVDWRAVERYAI